MQRVIDRLNDTFVYLAEATNEVEKLPHSERQALMYGMLCNQGKVLNLLLELARQEKEETCEKP